MSSENLTIEEIHEARRKSIEETIHTVSVEELRSLGEGLFPYLDHPWREKYFTFLTENAAATFHHAITEDRFHIIYCHAQGKGMWFIPGSGMGPLQEKGLKALSEIVEGK